MIVTVAAETPQTTTEVLRLAEVMKLGARTIAVDSGETVIGIDGALPADSLDLPGVVRVVAKHRPYMLASNEHRAKSIVRVGDVEIGADRPVIMAGPCVVESREDIIRAAIAVKHAGATILRGGAFKPRTSPYSFQGLGEDGLKHLADAREVTGMPVVTEVMEPDQIELVAEYADMLQIGSRNMANFPLLRKVGKLNKPVLLKRGFSATVDEWLMSAEYVMSGGNANVVLCERGIRGFDPAVRFNLDLNAVPLVKELSHLPVIVDPSHGTGRRSMVPRMALAGLAAGADGLIIEAHPDPDSTACDSAQTITPAVLRTIHLQGMAMLEALAADHSAVEETELAYAD
jgi:3-deoxy-7-phosphoheptulonate synthase